jgi:hypothetical protein
LTFGGIGATRTRPKSLLLLVLTPEIYYVLLGLRLPPTLALASLLVQSRTENRSYMKSVPFNFLIGSH